MKCKAHTKEEEKEERLLMIKVAMTSLQVWINYDGYDVVRWLYTS